MQWNQPFGQVAFENIPNKVYYQTNKYYAPPFRAIGEGEVTSVYIPDGSTQMYFIPTTRYDRWPPHQYNINFPNVNNFHKNLSNECWFVRSVSFPILTGFNNQVPNPCENSSTPPFTPNYSTNLPLSQTEYYQKFHNDNATSTTDITYFYPSLRPEKISYNSTLVQTNKPSANYISYDGVNKCPCRVSFRVEKEICNECMCQERASSMSVDSVKNTSSEHSIKNKKNHIRSKRKSKSKRSKRICKCSDDVKQTSDKLVTTYVDTASGNVESKGRDTQTARNLKPETWLPIKRKSTTSPKSSTSTIDQLFCLTTSNDCTCASLTDTDSQ